MRSDITPREQKMLDILTAAAEAGQVCPTNDQLCSRMGMQSVGAPPRIINRLIELGLIRVERFSISRIVTIVATGKSTAGDRGKPHFRAGKKADPVSPLLSEEQSDQFRQKVTAYLQRTGCTGSRLSTFALGHPAGVSSIGLYGKITRKVASKLRSVMDRYPDGLHQVPLSEALSAQDMKLSNEQLEARRGEAERRQRRHAMQCLQAHRQKYGDAPFGKPLDRMVV